MNIKYNNETASFLILVNGNRYYIPCEVEHNFIHDYLHKLYFHGALEYKNNQMLLENIFELFGWLRPTFNKDFVEAEYDKSVKEAQQVDCECMINLIERYLGD